MIAAFLKRFLFILLVFSPIYSYSQDIFFAQQQLNKLYLNPAYSCVYSNNTFFSHYRNQYPVMANGFKTYNVWYNVPYIKSGSGISVGLMQDNLPGNLFSTNQFDFAYAHKIKVGLFKYVAVGLQASLILNSIKTGGIILAQPENIASRNVFEPQFSAGILYYNLEWVAGLTLNDLSSIISFNKNKLTTMGLTMHVEKKINLFMIEGSTWEKATILTPSIMSRLYMNRISYIYGTLVEKQNIIAGVWIRNGFPFYFTDFIAGLGYKINNVRLFYTYDFNAHSLTYPLPLTQSHEVTLQIQINKKPHKNFPRKYDCPDFEVNSIKENHIAK